MVTQSNYPNKKKTQGNGQLILIIIAFITGYLSSSIIDVNHLGNIVNSYLVKINQHVDNKQQPEMQPILAHQPKLEFYTVLAQKTEHKVPIGTDLQKMIKPEEVKPPQIKPEAHNDNTKKGQYVVQLASFRYYSQAQQFRAKLILKGYDVSIAAINKGTLKWYRVMMGPYSNQVEAQKAQYVYSKSEHVTGMVKPIDT